LKNNQTIPDNDISHESSKRQFLRGLTALMGTAAVSQLMSGDALASAFNYQGAESSYLKKGKLFSQPQMHILHDICSVVLPKTDTPSAAELGVHGFLDHQLSVCYSQQQQQQAINIVDQINQLSETNFSKNFIALSAEQQNTLLVALEAEALGFTAQDKQSFIALKSLLVFGYFTTEVGATQALNYQAVPGGFKGSVSYSSLKKSWGSLAYY
jgi:hypothetical protein